MMNIKELLVAFIKSSLSRICVFLLIIGLISACVYDPNADGRGSYKGSYYEVKQGDTVYLISYVTDRDVNDIIAFNNLEYPYTIYPGQQLNLWRPVYVPPKFGQAGNTQTSQTSSSSTTKVPVEKPSQPIADGDSNAYVDNTSTTQEQGQHTQTSQSSNITMNQKVTKWIWPTKGEITGKFALGDQGNKGIDITGKRGQPVVSTAAGIVVYAGNALRGYGNLLIIKHNEEYLSAYAHNDSLTVAEGDTVKAGQQVATLGSTGTNSVRLHFEIRYQGKPVNPENYLP